MSDEKTTTCEPAASDVLGVVMPFSLEFWEKKTITVTAESYSLAAKQVPKDCTFESVRKQGDDYADRLTEYDYCHLCGQPMLQNSYGPVDRWAKIELDPADDCPFVTRDDCVHESCADSLGRTVFERMRA